MTADNEFEVLDELPPDMGPTSRQTWSRRLLDFAVANVGHWVHAPTVYKSRASARQMARDFSHAGHARGVKIETEIRQLEGVDGAHLYVRALGPI